MRAQLPEFQRIDSAAWPRRNRDTSIFGDAVAIEGDVAVAGVAVVPWSPPDIAGAAFVYERRDGVWTEAARLDPAYTLGHQGFGARVAVDGGRVFVFGGLRENDRRALFRTYARDATGHWKLREEVALEAVATQIFDAAVCGDVAVVACPGLGRASVRILRRGEHGWVETQSIEAPEDGLSRSRVAELALDSGVFAAFWELPAGGAAVRVFRDTDGTFVEEASFETHLDAPCALGLDGAAILSAPRSAYGAASLRVGDAAGWPSDPAATWTPAARRGGPITTPAGWVRTADGDGDLFVAVGRDPPTIHIFQHRDDGWYHATLAPPSPYPAGRALINSAIDGRSVVMSRPSGDRGLWFFEITDDHLARATKL